MKNSKFAKAHSVLAGMARLCAVVLIGSFLGCTVDGGGGGGNPGTGTPALEGTVSLTGTAMVGEPLTANTGSLLGTGVISYVWKRGDTATPAGTPISGAVSASYTPVDADLNKYITVTVTRAGHSGDKSAVSDRVAAAGTPALEGTVSLTGTATVGGTLTADTGNLQATSDLFYRWKRGDTAAEGGTPISGATSETYTLVPADRGKYITVTVRCNGYNGEETSNAIGPVVYAIGSPGPGGGIIFYISTAGFTNTLTGATCYYLEAAPADMSTALAWASSDYTDTFISGTQRGIGTGATNTVAILAADPDAPAAKACNEYTNGGKDDWFLPSYDELAQMYENRTAAMAIAGAGYWHWSSWQYTYDYNPHTNWAVGTDFSATYNYPKYYTSCVRAVRAF